MSVRVLRRRIVFFRLDDEEFERLRAGVDLSRSRSVSDFCRTAAIEKLNRLSARGSGVRVRATDGYMDTESPDAHWA